MYCVTCASTRFVTTKTDREPKSANYFHISSNSTDEQEHGIPSTHTHTRTHALLFAGGPSHYFLIYFLICPFVCVYVCLLAVNWSTDGSLSFCLPNSGVNSVWAGLRLPSLFAQTCLQGHKHIDAQPQSQYEIPYRSRSSIWCDHLMKCNTSSLHRLD